MQRRGEDGSGRDSGNGIVIGRPFGVPVYVTPTWFLVAGLITYLFAPSVENDVPGIGQWKYAVSLGYAVLLYGSVLIHELAHTLVALRGGLPVRRISLYFLGGVSEIGEASKSPRQEAWIAAAGPLVSVVLGVAAYVVAQALEPDTVGRSLADALWLSNLLVGAFNLLPGLPLDGGRVLAAAVWGATGRRHTRCGRCRVGGPRGRRARALPAVTRRPSPSAASPTSSTWSGAPCSARSSGPARARPCRRAGCSSASRACPPARSPGGPSRSRPTCRSPRRCGGRSRPVRATSWWWAVTARPLALVNEAAALAIPENRRPWVPVSDVARRIQPDLVVSADLAGHDLVEAITRFPSSEYLVVEPTGEVFGVLATADVERAVARA